MSAIDPLRQPALLPQLEAQLYRKAAEQAAPAPARRRRRRFTAKGLLFLGLGLAGLGGTAVASYPVWSPWLGIDADQRPSTTTEPPPASQRRLLEPLRRPQTSDDRGDQVTRAMRMQREQYRGINLDAVRLLGRTRTGAPIVLFTTQVTRRTDGTGQDEHTICLFVASSRDAIDGGTGCLETGAFKRYGVQLGVGEPVALDERGEVPGARRRADGLWEAPLPDAARGALIVGLVPDGVRRVTLGRGLSAPVRGNVYEIAVDDVGRLRRPQLHTEP